MNPQSASGEPHTTFPCRKSARSGSISTSGRSTGTASSSRHSTQPVTRDLSSVWSISGCLRTRSFLARKTRTCLRGTFSRAGVLAAIIRSICLTWRKRCWDLVKIAEISISVILLRGAGRLRLRVRVQMAARCNWEAWIRGAERRTRSKKQIHPLSFEPGTSCCAVIAVTQELAILELTAM